MRNIFLILMYCIFFPAFAQTPTFQWARSFGSIGTEESRGVCVDGAGNVYISGSFFNTVDFDPGIGVFNLTAIGTADLFILKLDANGNFIWVKQIGGLNQEIGYHLKTDALGNLYYIGMFQGTVDFDPGAGTYPLSNMGNGSQNSFILKLDANGNFTWAKQLGTGVANATVCRDICIDAAGNVLIAGVFQGTNDFDPGPGVFNLITVIQATAFVLKLDINGNFVWADKLGGSGVAPVFSSTASYGEAVVVDGNGNVYVGGNFSETSDFDPGPAVLNLTAVGVCDGYISKLDANGNFIWVRQFSGTGQGAIVRGLACDCAGNICCGGPFWGVFDVDPGPATSTLTTFGGSDIFVAKLDAAGNFFWGKQMGGGGSDFLWELDSDPVGDVYFTGSYASSPADFDPGPATYTLGPVGLNDIFLAKLNNAGNFAWAYGMGSVNNETAYEITTDPSFNVYACGHFNLTVDFDPSASVSNLTSMGGTDNFVTKLSQVTTTLTAPVPAPSSLTLCAGLSASLSAVGSGTLVWYVTPTTPIPMATGSVYTTPALYNTTVYYVESQVCNFNSSRASVTVNVIPAPSLTLATTNTLVCKGTVRTVTVSGAQSYLWSNTATTSVITVTPSVAASSYTVSGTGSNSCTATASIAFSVLLCTGLETQQSEVAGAFVIYPNPGSGSFNILTERDLVLKISNETGQAVKTISVKAGEQRLLLSDLSAGIYFVSVVDSAVRPQKIIILR